MTNSNRTKGRNVSKRILSIGQCTFDAGSIADMIRTNFRAEVSDASSAREALERLQQDHFDLVLINRVLDADGSSGLDIVKQIKSNAATLDTPVMIVSNHEDAQQAAVAAGAEWGFGKAALNARATIAVLERFLG